MLHACIVLVPTCFMCIFIQYLAFSGTNLLTRCHSASSYFMLFLCFRKVLHEIFSELHGTKTECLIIPSRSHRQKGRKSGATGRPDTRLARALGWPCRACVWATLASSDSTSSPVYSPYGKNAEYLRKNPKKVPQPPLSTNPSREGSAALPGTLPEGESITGGLYIAMPASTVMCE